MLDGVTSLMVPFVGMVFVIFLAYVGTKYISGRYAKMSSGRNMKVLERVALGQDKFLVLVAINKKAYLLGVTNTNISTVCEFNEEDIAADAALQKTDFPTLFADGLKKYSFLHMPSKSDENGEKR